MAENLWRWHRRQAVVAISLIIALWAGLLSAYAQETPTVSEKQPVQAAKTALRDLHVSALSSDDKIAVDWRFVSDGESIKITPERETPKVSVSGVKIQSADPISFPDQEIESVVIVLLSGRNTAELDYMRVTSAAALTALSEGSYRVLIGVNGDAFAWVKDTTISKISDIPALFYPIIIQDVKPSGNKKALTTGYAAALEALKAASPRARAALIVPEPLIPQNQDLLTRLGNAAFVQRISIFPVAPEGGVSAARAQQMIDLAGPSAARFLPDALEGRPVDERRAMFAEFQGGSSQVFTVDPKSLYSLPFEKPKPVRVTVDYGDLTDTMTLALPHRPLKGLSLVGAMVNPAHWVSWIATPGRRRWGLACFALWLFVFGLLQRLLLPPVKVYVQIAGEDNIQKIRRLPAHIGRSAAQEIYLNHEGISRDHAVIEKNGKLLRLRDLGSTNGTFIGGEKIDTVPLRAVQTVQFGPVKLILRTQR